MVIELQQDNLIILFAIKYFADLLFAPSPPQKN